jgi:hypothetical protein
MVNATCDLLGSPSKEVSIRTPTKGSRFMAGRRFSYHPISSVYLPLAFDPSVIAKFSKVLNNSFTTLNTSEKNGEEDSSTSKGTSSTGETIRECHCLPRLDKIDSSMEKLVEITQTTYEIISRQEGDRDITPCEPVASMKRVNFSADCPSPIGQTTSKPTRVSMLICPSLIRASFFTFIEIS